MTLEDAQTRLTAVRAQIAKMIERGAMTGYSVRGRQVQRDYKLLIDEERRLEEIVAGLSDEGSCQLARSRFDL